MRGPSPADTLALRRVRARSYLAYAGEEQHQLYYIQEGWAARFRLLTDGRRQITALFLPGEYCEPLWLLGERPEQSIIALTQVLAHPVVQWSTLAGALQKLEPSSPILQAMIESFNRQSNWIVSLGRKTAIERLSDLFCDVFERMERAGLVYGDQCAMPLTQADLADIAGLTTVHVNRILHELKSRGLVELRSKWLRILDLESLRLLAMAKAA